MKKRKITQQKGFSFKKKNKCEIKVKENILGCCPICGIKLNIDLFSLNHILYKRL